MPKQTVSKVRIATLIALSLFSAQSFAASPDVKVTLDDQLTTDADSDGNVDRGDTVTYEGEVDNTTGTDSALGVTFEATLDPNTTIVPGSVKVSPIALDDNFDGLGGTTLSIAAADGLLKNDFDPKDINAPTNAGMSVVAETIATTQGGSVMINADGSFSYDPALGFSGADTFNYTVNDTDAMTDTAVATIDINGRVWFVDDSAAAGGNGSQAMPFNSFAAINGAGGAGDTDEAGDTIYIFAGTYADDLELEADQNIVGAGSALSAGAATIIPAGTAPTYSGAIGLASDNSIKGFAFTPSANYAITGSASSNSVISESSITLSASGGAFDLDNHTGNFSYTGNVLGATSTNAVAVDGGAPTIVLDGDVTLSGGRNIDLRNITGGGLSVTGTLSNNGGSALNVFNNTGSPSFEFDDLIVTSGVGTAVNLEDGATATYSFNGDFNVTTTNGSGLIANSGLLNFSDANTFDNVINATNGYAAYLGSFADVVNVGTLTFDSLTSNNSNEDAGVYFRRIAGSVEILQDITINDTAERGVYIRGGTAEITVLGDILVDGFGSSIQEYAAVEIDGDDSLGALVLGNITLRNGSISQLNDGVDIESTINPVTIGAVDVGNTNGDALSVGSNDASVTFASVDVGTTGAVAEYGIRVSGNGTGNIDFGSGSISNAGNISFYVAGGTGVVDYAGDIDHTASPTGVYFSNSGGTVNLSGDISVAPGSAFAVGLVSGDGTYNLTGAFTVDGADHVVLSDQSSGSLTIANVTATNITEKAITVEGGSMSLTIQAGSIAQSGAFSGIDIFDNTGGTITIGSSLSVNSSTADAIKLTNNPGVTVDLSGQLDLDSTSGKGLVATGGGTLSLSNAANLIESATGSLVELNGMTIGSGGININSAVASGTPAADVVNLTNVSGGTFALDNLTVAGTTNGDAVEINASSATTNIGTIVADNVNDAGVFLTGANGNVTINSVDLDAISGTGILIANNTNPISINGGTVGATTTTTGNAFDISGGSGDVTMAAAITNSQNRAIDITGRTGGTVNVSSTFNETGSGVNVTGNSGGTINLSGNSQVINLGGNTALTVNNNSGATINVTNGGLDIDTTTGTGVVMTGGGTVSVTGSGNTINSGGGVSLNVGGVTIGAADLNFQSISQNGGANAITLNNTGTSGSLVVTGSATTVGSGGTITNITDEAIRLTDTMGASFNGLDISNITHEAIKGVRVNGITVTNTDVDDAGSTEGVADDDTFGFDRDIQGDNGLFGTARFENVSITNTHERAIHIVNEGAGSLDLDIINVSIDDNDDTQGEDAIRVQSEGSINTDVLLSGGTYNNIESDVLAYSSQGTGTNNVTITGVTSTNGGGPDNFPNGGGLAIIGSAGSSTTFDVNNNNLTGVQAEGVQVVGLAGANQTLTMSGTINGNTFSSDFADGIDLDFDGDTSTGGSTMNITIDVNNNNISFDDDALGFDYRNAAGTSNITLRNNIFNGIAGTNGVLDTDDGIIIFVEKDTGVSSGASFLNLAINNNTINGIDAAKNTIEVVDIRDLSATAGNAVNGCFNFSNNSAGNIDIDIEPSTQVVGIVQASIAALAAANNGSTVSVPNEQPTFNSTACSSVPLP